VIVANREYWAGCIVGLCVHEAGHICMALALGLHVKRVGMSWWGPYIVRETGSPTADAMVCAAGPLANLLLALIMWHDLSIFAMANLTLGISNLLPFSKCDGGRILRALSLVRRSGRITEVPATASLDLTA
jgi:Zn-dependent protease